MHQPCSSLAPAAHCRLQATDDTWPLATHDGDRVILSCSQACLWRACHAARVQSPCSRTALRFIFLLTASLTKDVQAAQMASGMFFV